MTHRLFLALVLTSTFAVAQTPDQPAIPSVVVSARYAVDDADELLGADLPHGTWDTVGGLMLDLFGRVPDEGNSVEVEGFRLTALDVRGRRIGRVRIEPTARVPSSGPTAE